jgi:hypothetical protein
MRDVAKQVASLRKELQSHPQWQAASIDIEDRAALRYLAMRMMNKPRPQRIETFIERFGDTKLGQSIAKDRAKEVAAIKASGKHEEGKPIYVDAAKITKPYDLEERFLETEPPLFFDPHFLYDKTRKPISAERIEDKPYTAIIDRIKRRMGIERKNFRKALGPRMSVLKSENASAEQKAAADRYIQDTIKDIFTRLAAAKEAVKKAKPSADAARKEALAATQEYQASKRAFEQASQELADKTDSPEAGKELAAKKAAYEKAGDALSKAERSSVVAGRELGLKEHDVRVLENRVLILKEYKLIE